MFSKNGVLYDLVVKTDDDNNINFDEPVAITISVKDEDGEEEIIAEVESDYIKPFE